MMDNRDNQRWDIFGASVISRMHRVLCDLGITFHYFRRRRSNRNRGLDFEELELDRLELDKQEVEQPEVDRLELDEPGVGRGKQGVVEFDLKSGLDNYMSTTEVTQTFAQRFDRSRSWEIDFSCQGVKLSPFLLTQQLRKRFRGWKCSHSLWQQREVVEEEEAEVGGRFRRGGDGGGLSYWFFIDLNCSTTGGGATFIFSPAWGDAVACVPGTGAGGGGGGPECGSGVRPVVTAQSGVGGRGGALRAAFVGFVVGSCGCDLGSRCEPDYLARSDCEPYLASDTEGKFLNLLFELETTKVYRKLL
ncbi:hypothetical protein Tco_1429961 [Tanacetum coccineum]